MKNFVFTIAACGVILIYSSVASAQGLGGLNGPRIPDPKPETCYDIMPAACTSVPSISVFKCGTHAICEPVPGTGGAGQAPLMLKCSLSTEEADRGKMVDAYEGVSVGSLDYKFSHHTYCFFSWKCSCTLQAMPNNPCAKGAAIPNHGPKGRNYMLTGGDCDSR